MINAHNLIPSKRVTLSINGSSEQSISIELEIRFTDSNQLVSNTISGRLSPLPPQLLAAYADWKQSYLQWGNTCRYWQSSYRSISIPTNPIETNVSI